MTFARARDTPEISGNTLHQRRQEPYRLYPDAFTWLQAPVPTSEVLPQVDLLCHSSSRQDFQLQFVTCIRGTLTGTSAG